MLLPHVKEREYRFRLALRMGLPIFALIIAFISHTLINTYETLQATFYFEAVLLLTFSIYFIFYLIYNGFDMRITDEVSKTFTREYLYKYLKNEIKENKEYSLVLISINNLDDINTTYGIKNGDKILKKTALWIGKYFESKDIKNFPLGHIKGGDFILGLKGNKSEYKTVLELLSLKVEDFKIDDIEIQLLATITDTNFSTQIDYMIEELFELQKDLKTPYTEESLDPNELDLYVINAIKNKKFLIATQDVFENEKSVIKECFIKLQTSNNKILFPKNYIKVINRLGLTLDFDLMVIEQSIKNYNIIADEILAFNISATSIRNSNFLIKIKEILVKYPMIENKMMFITSEMEYYSQIKKYKETINTLRSMGIKIVIDRLGAIHTSFLYLRDLDIDIVRFDSYYTKNIKNKEIVEGFNTMAHKKGVKTWIKNIQTQEMKEFAQQTGVDYLQGKYLCELKIYQNGEEDEIR